MKKAVSVLLILCLLAITALVPTVYSSEPALDKNEAEEAVEAAVAELISEDVVSVEGADDLALEIENFYSGALTANKIADFLKRSIFINYEDADEIAANIVDNTKCYTVTLRDGRKTVYIAVNLERYPEIASTKIYRQVIDGLAEKQGEYAAEDYSLMTYEHLAGELILHEILYSATLLTGNNKKETPLYRFYNSARVADLNIDEKRIPPTIIELTGKVYMIIVNLLNSIFNPAANAA